MKSRYNVLLRRYYRAEQYFESEIPQEAKLSFFDDFKFILSELNGLLGEIGEYEPENVLNGF